MPHKDTHHDNLLHDYFDNRQIDGLYASVAIKSFAVSFIAIFIPIYLLNMGFALENVATYFLINYVIAFLFFSCGLKLNSKIGVKKVMSLGIFISIIYYLLLNYLSAENISIYLVSIVSGVSTGIYWAGFHMEFSKFSDNKKEARESSMINILSKITGAIGPILGAIFISYVSFNFLFLFSSALLFFSMIPLFLTKNEKTKYDFSIKGMLSADTKQKAMVYQVSAVLGVITAIFWPIFIFLTLKEVVSLGAIISLSAIVEIVFLFFIGRLSDAHKYKILKTGVFSHSFSWLTRFLFLSPVGIFFNNLYSSLTSSMIGIPFSKIIYEKSKKSKDPSNYFLFREFNLAIGRILILLVIILTSSIFWTFVIAFFITFIYLALLKDS